MGAPTNNNWAPRVVGQGAYPRWGEQSGLRSGGVPKSDPNWAPVAGAPMGGGGFGGGSTWQQSQVDDWYKNRPEGGYKDPGPDTSALTGWGAQSGGDGDGRLPNSTPPYTGGTTALPGTTAPAWNAATSTTRRGDTWNTSRAENMSSWDGIGRAPTWWTGTDAGFKNPNMTGNITGHGPAAVDTYAGTPATTAPVAASAGAWNGIGRAPDGWQGTDAPTGASLPSNWNWSGVADRGAQPASTAPANYWTTGAGSNNPPATLAQAMVQPAATTAATGLTAQDVQRMMDERRRRDAEIAAAQAMYGYGGGGAGPGEGGGAGAGPGGDSSGTGGGTGGTY